MAVERRASEAITTIEDQLVELSRILQKVRQGGDSDLARQRMQRWKERTVKLVAANISAEEAQKFSEIRMRAAFRDPIRTREVEANRYTTFLLPLIEVLREHPEDLLQEHPPPLDVVSRQSVVAGFVFIAMPMGSDDPLLEDVHEAIKEVATDIDLQAERVDDPQTNERISPRILESLRTAEFVVADLTHSKPNVYFEAGYAEAMGTTPVYIARVGTDLEFDVQDYPVIFFENVTDLKRDLARRLKGLKSGAT